MADPPAIDLEFDVSGHPAGAGGTISLDVVASASLEIPGLKLSVDKLRASLALGIDLSGGQLHLIPTAALALPEGAGAELDLPGFEGGGYLAHDPVTDEWRGALAAQLGVISVSGFAILGTEPSFLVLIAAEFTPAIQLSFGFTLVGVGGLVGINRRPDTDALSAAVSSGDLSKLLFPSDPIAQADHLLATLSECFPAQPGSFVVGPMLKLGWGTPTLVAATIGVLVSDAGVVILGRIAITLPFEELAIIRLEALVLGVIDANGLAIDASLANSNIVGVPVEGDIRLRARGGQNALFALSAGGFHPAFAPPDGMAGMHRIGATISPGPILTARLEAYLAVTTSSVQFGAHVELQAGIDGFGIKGHLDFDALFVFDPFGFMIDFSAGVSVECADFSVASIELSGHLSGTSPWRVRGHASISILWWDVDVDIPEITWGDANPPPLPPGARSGRGARARARRPGQLGGAVARGSAPRAAAARCRGRPRRAPPARRVGVQPDRGARRPSPPAHGRREARRTGHLARREQGAAGAGPHDARAVRRRSVPRARRERQALVRRLRHLRRRVRARRHRRAPRRDRRPRRGLRDDRARERRDDGLATVPAAARRSARRGRPLGHARRRPSTAGRNSPTPPPPRWRR